MQIFNTMTRQKEEFVPQKEGEYRIYVCGPTVYNYIHIGNARPMIVLDTLRRYLEYRGNKVIYVSNITDIDDKLRRVLFRSVPSSWPFLMTSSSRRARRRAPRCRRSPASLRPSTSGIPTV